MSKRGFLDLLDRETDLLVGKEFDKVGGTQRKVWREAQVAMLNRLKTVVSAYEDEEAENGLDFVASDYAAKPSD